MGHSILLEVGRISNLIIYRPERLNALDDDTLDAIEEAILSLEKCRDVRVIVVTGAGDKAIVAGADVFSMAEMSTLQAQELGKRGNKVFSIVDNSSKATVAAVNGFALGGGLELTLACDMRVSTASAKFGLPEINLGVIPGFGGTQRLARQVGLGRAKKLLFTGDIIGAD